MAETWTAVVYDQHGYVMSEHLVAWCQTQIEGKRWYLTDGDPETITVVKGSAKPEPQTGDPDEEFFRQPSSHYVSDVLYEVEAEDFDGDQLIKEWERAQAVASALNSANVP